MVQPPGLRFAANAVNGVNALMAQTYRDEAQRPALALGVHADRDRRAGTEPGQEQVIGCGAAVSTADGGWLVSGQVMAADGNTLAERPRVGFGHDHPVVAGLPGGRCPVARASGCGKVARSPRGHDAGRVGGIGGAGQLVIRVVQADEGLRVTGRLEDDPGIVDAHNLVAWCMHDQQRQAAARLCAAAVPAR